MKRIILFIALLITTCFTYSRTLTSNGNGEWDNPLSWTPVGAPSSLDTVIILTNDTITVDCNCGTYVSVLLQIYGGLEFLNGQKLRFNSPTNIEVYEGGKIYGNNPGTKITIDNNVIYRGTDTLVGPQRCDSAGCFPDATLPIELLYFRIGLSNNIATAEWSTLSEINNSHFHIEVADKELNWEIYAVIEGNGNSTRQLDYMTSFEYYNSYGYVRLIQYDYDGTRTQSEIYYMQNDNIDKSEWIQVFDVGGRKVRWRNGLEPGIYIVHFSNGYFKYIQYEE